MSEYILNQKSALEMTNDELEFFRSAMGIVITEESMATITKYKKLADTLPVGKSKTFTTRKPALALQRAMNNRGMKTSVLHKKRKFKVTRLS